MQLRTALFISGGGTTAEAIIRASRTGVLQNIKPVLVVASSNQAKGIQKAHELRIPTEVIARKDFPTAEKFGEQILRSLSHYNIDLISQNGWLPLTPPNIIYNYPNCIINQHPGPLDPGKPDFGGRGMYGTRVICARLLYSWITQSDFWTEVTVHYVTQEIDNGSLITIKRAALPKPIRKYTLKNIAKYKEELVTATLAVQKKLLPKEHNTVIVALSLFSTSHTPKPHIRRKLLIPVSNYELLQKVKDVAIQWFPKG